MRYGILTAVIMKVALLRDVTPCNVADRRDVFPPSTICPPTVLIVILLRYITTTFLSRSTNVSALKMEAALTSKTLVPIYQGILRYIPEETKLHI